MQRRHLIRGLAATVLPGAVRLAPAAADTEGEAHTLLREGGGGLVVAIRHALAPGTYDPPGFRVDVCSTQRNLSDEGRMQARGIGVWFREAGLAPSRVRASQWCRCLETARLAFGEVRPWPVLNSIAAGQGDASAQTAAAQTELARLAAANAPGFEVWVTHQANISALAQRPTRSGEGLLLRHDKGGAAVNVLASLRIG